MRKLLGTAALAVAVVASTALTVAPSQGATAEARAGTTSLAEVLAADGQEFDSKWGDFDIVEAAVYAVLDENKKSPVALLADGKTKLTAFAPTDKAFRKLVQDLTGKKHDSEKKVFKKVAALGIDTVETVLLYHVVAGKTLTSEKVLKADGTGLTTAQGEAVTVTVKGDNVKLEDLDPDAGNAKVIMLDINRGNRQIAHGINKVLRPVDL